MPGEKLGFMNVKGDLLSREEMRGIIAGSDTPCWQVCTDIAAACLNGNPNSPDSDGYNSYIDACEHASDCCFAACNGGGPGSC